MPFFYSHFFYLKIYDRLKEKLIKKRKHLREMRRSIYVIIIIRFSEGLYEQFGIGRTRTRENSKRIHYNSSNHSMSGMSACCCLSCRGIKCPQFFDNFSFNTKRTFPFLNLLLGFMFHRVFAGHKKLNVVKQNAFKKHIKGEEETC